jgi:DNA-binding response OmpR family regulator
VEDNEADVRLMEEALHEQSLAFRMHVCRDGEEARRLAGIAGENDAEPCPDLFILDLHLPKVDGPEVLRTFRANRNCAKTPVIVFSSSMSPADRVMVERYEGVSFLQKPIGLDEYMAVGQRVKEALTRRYGSPA